MLLFLRFVNDLEQNERKMPIVPENLQDFSGTMCLCVVLGEFALRDISLGLILHHGRNDLCELFVNLHVLFFLNEDYGKDY